MPAARAIGQRGPVAIMCGASATVSQRESLRPVKEDP